MVNPSFNVSMKFFRDRHAGKRIWVCGSGPSLLDVDVERLTDDDVVIACNSARLHFGVPHYWLMVDGGMPKCYYFDTADPDQVIILLNELLKPQNGKLFYVINQSSAWGDWGVYVNSHFPGNSTHRAVSFAFAMGARAIILAGCDATGHHPYDPYWDQFPQPFAEDIMLWNEMLRANPTLRLYTISPYKKTFILAKTFDQALQL
jgi:hypothetical protein